MKFVGRGGTHPSRGAARDGALANTPARSSIHPAALRRVVTVPPAKPARRPHHRHRRNARCRPWRARQISESAHGDRAFDLAWTHSQVTLPNLNSSETDARFSPASRAR